MALSRRYFLKLGGLTAVTATTTACSLAGRALNQDELPAELTWSEVKGETAVSPDPALCFLNLCQLTRSPSLPA
ncbi:MAG: hypothetical protein KC423_06950 [Anaerolineales bacterium]|nr:hypothetical protein [Anaerolineales bacterium]